MTTTAPQSTGTATLASGRGVAIAGPLVDQVLLVELVD